MAFTKKCPACGMRMSYVNKYALRRSLERGIRCRSCTYTKSPDIKPGDTFGKLTTVSPILDGSSKSTLKWLCICACGANATPRAKALKSGGATSCGCLRSIAAAKARPNLIGQRFGQLTVIRFSGVLECTARWDCLCDCGTLITLRANVLRPGKRGQAPRQGSCGCHKKRMRVLPHRYVMASYSHSAKDRGLDFALSDAQFKQLLSQRCAYCNTPPLQKLNRCQKQNFREHVDFRYNGVDRIDSALGYTPENCVACCTVCNRMKLDYSRTDFLAHIAAIYGHMSSRQHLTPGVA